MKKKIVAMCATVALAALAVGGTLAYFTDTDKDVNVMTSGNVQIVQNEQDREGEPWQEDGIAELVPAVYLDAQGNPYTPPAGSYAGPGGNGPHYDADGNDLWYTGTMEDTDGEGTVKIYDGNIENEVDKIISVTNEGTLPAYVRTILLVENDAQNKICDKVHMLYGFSPVWVMNGNVEDQVTIGGTTYSIAVFTYEEALAPEATTSPSLIQVFLNPNTDNSWYELLGEDKQLSMIALSQAAQTAGFGSASEALDTAFGEVNSANVAQWVAETGVQTPNA